jgi:hypothetical protein
MPHAPISLVGNWMPRRPSMPIHHATTTRTTTTRTTTAD